MIINDDIHEWGSSDVCGFFKIVDYSVNRGAYSTLVEFYGDERIISLVWSKKDHQKSMKWENLEGQFQCTNRVVDSSSERWEVGGATEVKWGRFPKMCQLYGLHG